MIYLGNNLVNTHLGNNSVKVKSLVNVLDFSTRTDIIDTNAEGGNFDRSNARNFSETQLWNALTRNNYFIPAGATYSIGGQDITVTTHAGGYGIAIPFKIIPNARYFLKSDTSKDYITFGVYDVNGYQTRFLDDNASKNQLTFNPGEGWFTVCFTTQSTGVNMTYKNPKLYYTLEE